MNRRDFFQNLCAASLAATAAAYAVKDQTPFIETPKESAYQRSARTGELRFAYADWMPLIWKDAKSGEIKGIFYEYAMAMARSLDLKIEWSSVGWGDYIAGLNTGKFDAMCAGVWPVAAVIKAADFTKPIYYIPIGTYVREGDVRFDKNLAALNAPDKTVATVDGLIPARIAESDFPKAKVYALPQSEPTERMLLAVASSKADVTFTDRITAGDFMKANPKALREVTLPRPIRIFGNTIAVRKGEQDLLNMLNFATDELLTSGEIDAIISRYEPWANTFLRIATPYTAAV